MSSIGHSAVSSTLKMVKIRFLISNSQLEGQNDTENVLSIFKGPRENVIKKKKSHSQLEPNECGILNAEQPRESFSSWEDRKALVRS